MREVRRLCLPCKPGAGRRALLPPLRVPEGTAWGCVVIRLDLPRPRSVNELYLNVPGKGRVKTAEYKAFANEAGWMICAQGRPAQLMGKYEIQIAVKRWSARADIGNFEKGISDVLQQHDVIEDDKHAERICIWWSEDLPEGVDCRVWIQPVGGQS